MGLVFVRRSSQNRLLTIFGILLLAGFLHGNVAIQVLHDVSQFHSSSPEQNPEGNPDDGSPGSDGDEIAAPCPVCSSVPARALTTEIEVVIPAVVVPAVDPRPLSGSRWASPCFISFEARAPPSVS